MNSNNDLWKITFILRSMLFLLFLGSLLVSCAGTKDRLNLINALDRMREIRKAEEVYKQSSGKDLYGNLMQLTNSNLIRKGLEDGIEDEYRFVLKVHDAGYSLRVSPLKQPFNDDSDATFFMDETGVIRSSARANDPAGRRSEPIGNQ